MEKYNATYMFGLPPNGEKLWPPAQGYPVIPPAAEKTPSRHKKNRKRDLCPFWIKYYPSCLWSLFENEYWFFVLSTMKF